VDKPVNLFQAASDAPSGNAFDLEKLTQAFGQQRNTDWSIPEAFLGLLLSAAAADGNIAAEEQAEVYALVRRSRALKSMTASQLAHANATVNQRLQNRPNGLQEACISLPFDMRLPVFAHCVDIILADGELLQSEADFLNALMRFLELDPDDAKRMLDALLIKNRF
jgi:uncharacterized tellurite resistance protein B-like protein